MAGAPEPRWWRRRRDLALQAARDAKGRAAVALVDLDGAQRGAASHLEFIAGVDSGTTAARLRGAWQPVSAAADAAIAAYLDDAARWDVTEDLEVEDASAAAAAFDGHAAAMDEARTQIDDWSQRSTADFVRVTKTLDQLAGQRTATEQALSEAHEALEQTERAGLVPRRARDLLLQALERFAVVEQGPARAGMSAVLQACQDAAALAARARDAAAELPAQRDRVLGRLRSLDTRRSALEWRVEEGDDDVMRVLRREFTAGCSADLEDNPAEARAALDRARRAVAEAQRAAGRQAWEDATTQLEAARDAFDEVQRHVAEPKERLELLRSVRADPSAARGRARFALRDARQLLMAGAYDPRQARSLDALAARLDDVDALLDRPHPDWLTYAHTLDAIVDGARGLVVDIRASRAR